MSAASATHDGPLSAVELKRIHAWWRAANYVAAGQYSLSHAFGAAFDNPDLLVACIIGDGEAETGPLATAWHSNKFLNPARDGAVLPILHLNGYKIANPTVLARTPRGELESLHPHELTNGEFDAAAHAGQAHRPQALRHPARRRHAGGAGLGLAAGP
jgi:phosphoketolase